MSKPRTKFTPEVCERTVRMTQEARKDYPSLWSAIESIVPKVGCTPQTLNEWVRKLVFAQADLDRLKKK